MQPKQLVQETKQQQVVEPQLEHCKLQEPLEPDNKQSLAIQPEQLERPEQVVQHKPLELV